MLSILAGKSIYPRSN